MYVVRRRQIKLDNDVYTMYIHYVHTINGDNGDWRGTTVKRMISLDTMFTRVPCLSALNLSRFRPAEPAWQISGLSLMIKQCSKTGGRP